MTESYVQKHMLEGFLVLRKSQKLPSKTFQAETIWRRLKKRSLKNAPLRMHFWKFSRFSKELILKPFQKDCSFTLGHKIIIGSARS